MNLLKPILSIAIFFASQLVAGIIALAVSLDTEDIQMMSQGKDVQPSLSAETVAWTTIFSGIASVIIIHFALKSIKISSVFKPRGIDRMTNWGAYILAITGTLAGLLGANILNEQLDLPNLMEQEFYDMSQSFVGMLSLGIIAPIVEELIFRESIEGHFLRNGAKPWMAITISALAFGIIHINPAQVIFAFIIGILFGILYWKTHNVLLCSFLHILNNLFAVYEMRQMSEATSAENSFSDTLGSTTIIWSTLLGCTALCIVLTWAFCRIYKPTIAEEA